MALKMSDAFKNLILSLVHPVGTVYLCVDSANPSTKFGGTWVQIAQGRALCGVGTATGLDDNTVTFASEGTLGYVQHVHTTKNLTLTVDQIPSHTHVQDAHSHVQHKSTWINKQGDGYIPKSGTYYATADLTTYATNNTTATNQNTGGGLAHNHGTTGQHSNLQPSIGVYVWKRTA